MEIRCRLFDLILTILKLTVLIETIVYHQNTAMTFMAEAKRLVLSSSNTSITSESCHLDQISDGRVSVQENPEHYSCSLQVQATLGYLTSIELLEDKDNGYQLVYIERKGNDVACPNRHVVIGGQNDGCMALFQHNNLEITLYGNVSVVVSELKEIGVWLSHCPEFVTESASRSNHSCTNVTSYSNVITCASHNDYYYFYDIYYSFVIEKDGICFLNFMSNCNKSLGKQEVVFQCFNDNFLQNQTFLLMYTIGIKELFLGVRSIINIGNDAFQHVPKLKVLNLFGNQLEALRRYAFRGLKHLTNLNLGKNKLHTLPLGVFDELHSLNSLYLNKNDLKVINEFLFQELTKLSLLDLGENTLVQLPQYVFRGLTYVFKLDIRGNNLHTLHLHTFEGLVNVSKLILYQNNLKAVDETLFHDLKNMTYLDLGCNALVELPRNIFKGLTKLTHLSLEGNNLNTLPGNIFDGLGNLIWLQLQNDKMTLLDANVFLGVPKLTQLYLNTNNLSTLPVSIEGLENLVDLTLSENQLQVLAEGLFNNMTQMKYLSLSLNRLVVLPRNIFEHLTNLETLDLRGNKLNTLPVGIFEGLESLQSLILSSNPLETLDGSLFRGLDILKGLFLLSNNLKELPSNLFHGLGHLETLNLGENQLKSLNPNISFGLTDLTMIDISYNLLTELPVALLHGLQNLKWLYATDNRFIAVNVNLFKKSPGLVSIDLKNDSLINLPSGLFRDLDKLMNLYLAFNKFTSIPYNLFYGLVNLRIMSLHHNEIGDLDERIFKDSRKLEDVSLNNNRFKGLKSSVFKGLTHMGRLHLGGNYLSELNFDLFKDTIMLTYIDLRNNMLTNIPNNLIQLTYLNLRDNVLTYVDDKSFSRLAKSVELFVSQHEICKCYVDSGISCSAFDERSPYLTCNRLLSDRVLVILMWLIGINALGGNIFVLEWRRRSPQKGKVQDVLLTNLALSDFLMGVYMLIIASADVYFGQHFPMQSETWRSGIACRIAGAVSIISSEASVFFVTLISIDRFICIRFPFSTRKLTKKIASVTTLITWMFSLALGTVPSILSGRNFKFYDNSHVCIGLPLALVERFRTAETFETLNTADGGSYPKNTFLVTPLGSFHGLYFSSAVFLGLNCLCYFIIFGCYVEIVRAVLKSSRQAKLNKEMKDQVRMTAKVAAIVATDFCCWFPIIVMAILVQTRLVTLPPSVYAWSVTFVLPINSAINPYLYTISAIISDRKKHTNSQLTDKATKSVSVSQQVDIHTKNESVSHDTRSEGVSVTKDKHSLSAADLQEDTHM